MQPIIINAVWNEKAYHHFGIHPSFASLYGDRVDDIVQVELSIAEDQSLPISNTGPQEADYWGWLKKGESKFCMIYAQRFLVDICFPHGIRGAEEFNEGKAYRLDLKLIGPLSQENNTHNK